MHNLSYDVVALEPRTLLASIAGTVFNDTDSSRVLTSNEVPLKGQIIYIDANHNAKLDKGERSTTTAQNGTYRFSNLPTGTYDVAQVMPKNYIQTSPSSTGSIEGRYDILVRYKTKMTPAQQAAFQIAAARWQSIIVGDLPDVRTDLGTTDDLIIDASVVPIDGVGLVLGQAAPNQFRDKSFLPSRGFMQFDAADLRSLEASGNLVQVITHEMGHVLGIGTIWDKQRRIINTGTTNVQLKGANAVAQYNAIFDKHAVNTPIESLGGGGTAEGHWPEIEFGNELMTGYVTAPGVVAPLSKITVGQLQDDGYQVDYTHADKYDPFNNTNDKYWKPADAGVLPFQKRITLNRTDAQNNIDFGIRPNRKPKIGSFTILPGAEAVKGNIITLRAGASDPDGDKLLGTTFYRESNGIAGLQPGSDTYIASKLTSKRGVFAVTTATDGLSLGAQKFYVSAVDTFGTAGRTTASVQLVTQITASARTAAFSPALANRTANFYGDSLIKALNIAGDSDDAMSNLVTI